MLGMPCGMCGLTGPSSVTSTANDDTRTTSTSLESQQRLQDENEDEVTKSAEKGNSIKPNPPETCDAGGTQSEALEVGTPIKSPKRRLRSIIDGDGDPQPPSPKLSLSQLGAEDMWIGSPPKRPKF